MNQIECGFPIDTALVEYGPYLNVYIGTDTTFYPDSSDQLKGPYRALIDTGASQNCIDKILAQQIGLTPIDEQTSYGHQEHLQPLYIQDKFAFLTFSGKFMAKL